MDLNKSIVQKYGSSLDSIKSSRKVAVVIDDVYAESIDVETDIPYNVVSSKIQQGQSMLVLALPGGGTAEVPEEKLDVYYSKRDIIESAEDYFEGLIDVSEASELYDILSDFEEDDLDDNDLDDEFLDNYN